MKNNNIILIGFMGSGKTSFGKWLEDNCSMEMIDTDEYIEKNENREIKDIFANEGEEYFRQLETDAIKALISQELHDKVISVGGGLPIRAENGELLRELGTVIYLKATEDTLVGRLKGDTKRPLLQGGDLRDRIRTLMNKRAAIYEERADVIVETDNLTFEEIYKQCKKVE